MVLAYTISKLCFATGADKTDRIKMGKAWAKRKNRHFNSLFFLELHLITIFCRLLLEFNKTNCVTAVIIVINSHTLPK